MLLYCCFIIVDVNVGGVGAGVAHAADAAFSAAAVLLFPCSSSSSFSSIFFTNRGRHLTKQNHHSFLPLVLPFLPFAPSDPAPTPSPTEGALSKKEVILLLPVHALTPPPSPSPREGALSQISGDP